MPRGRRRASLPPAAPTTTPDVSTLESELAALKARETELRQQVRQLRSGSSEIRKLEEKLESQLATAKWTVKQIQELKPDWDDVGFYGTVRPTQPTPRGRRPRSAPVAE